MISKKHFPYFKTVFLVFAFFTFLPIAFADDSDEKIEYPVDTRGYIGPSDLAIDAAGEFLFVAEFDAARLRKVRIDGTAPAEILELPFKPERMKIFTSFTNAQSLAIVGGEGKGQLAIVDCRTLQITHNVSVGYYPSDVSVFQPSQSAQSQEKPVAYVSNRFGGDISVVDLETGKEIKRLPFGREPIALAVTPDGRKLIAVPQNPEDPAIDSGIALTIRIYDTASGAVKKLHFNSGIFNGRCVTLSPDGKFAFITCILGHFLHIPTDLDGGWMVENMLAVVNLETEQLVNTFYLDDYGHAAGNAWGVCCSVDSKFIAVAHSGGCEIVLLNLEKVLSTLNVKPRSNSGSHDIIQSLPTKMRVPTGLYGTRQLVMHGNKIYFTAYFEDSIGRIETDFTEPIENLPGFMMDRAIRDQPRRIQEPLVFANETKLPLVFEKMTPLNYLKGVRFQRSVARLGPEPQLSQIRFGNLLFHDTTRCYQQWASCDTCHPDGRADSMNWDLLNDGMGNPKNTKSMLLAHETPPAMVSGIRKNAEIAVRSGFSAILFNSRPENETLAVDEYLKSLQPVPSPHLVDGKLSESARRGQRIFKRVGCDTCHAPPLYTDLRLHNVKTANQYDTHIAFDTPTLIEVWRTAPYLHDGRYTTMKELIADGKHYDAEGRIDQLNEQEIDDLVEYVLSL